jgi:anti-sigma factor RsiW
MSCDECLLSLEEYVYGELTASDSGCVSAHIAGCEACASEHAQMQREQELYARCRVKAPPMLWAAVLGKIEEERLASASAPSAAPEAWLVGALGGRQLRWGVASAAGLILLVSVGWFLSGVTHHGTAPRQQVEAVAAGSNMTVLASRRAGEAPEPDRLRQEAPGSAPNSGNVPQSAVRWGSDYEGAAPGAVVARRVTRRRAPSAPAEAMHTTTALSSVAVGPRLPWAAAEINNETARHFERARMLLRSFKNGRLSEEDLALDIAYERRLSRELLGKNNLLRADARSEGNEAAERLLSRLEPFLLEIANLGETSTPEEVHSIKERIQSEGIIARLGFF